MNPLCESCKHRSNYFCNAVTSGSPSLHHLRTCPVGLWGRAASSPLLPQQHNPFTPENPLKLLWLMGDYAQGGTSRYTSDLIPILQSLPIEITVVYINKFKEHDAHLAAQVTSPIHHIEDVDVNALIKQADVISSIGINAHHANAAALLAKCKGKLFCQIHGTCQYSKDLLTFCRQFTDKFLACSARAATEADFFVPPVPLNYNRLHRQKTKAEARQLLHLPQDKMIVCAAARVSLDKNWVGMAEAVARTGAHFLMVGSGYAEAEIRPQVAAVLKDRLTILPWAHGPTEYLDATDVFLCLSPDEGLPLTIIEAMVHGTPVCSTPVGVTPVYRLTEDGELDQRIVYEYTGPDSIKRAASGLDEKTQCRILKYLLSKHSPFAIRKAWAKFLSLDQP